jgi:cytochrome c oxidase subunit IV
VDFSFSASLSGAMMATPAAPSLRSLVIVYVATMLLLTATVGAAMLPLGALGLLVALSIAAAKAILIILYFMQVRFESRAVWVFVAAGFFWLAILFTMTFSDYISRPWLPRTQPIPPTLIAR